MATTGGESIVFDGDEGCGKTTQTRLTGGWQVTAFYRRRAANTAANAIAPMINPCTTAPMTTVPR